MAAYRIAIMNNDTRKFGYDNMHATKTKKGKNMKRTSLRTFNVNFSPCNAFAFYKNLLCRLQSSCLRHDVKNRRRKVQINKEITAKSYHLTALSLTEYVRVKAREPRLYPKKPESLPLLMSFIWIKPVNL